MWDGQVYCYNLADQTLFFFFLMERFGLGVNVSSVNNEINDDLLTEGS